MGTSQSFKLKSNPNWTSAKKALTRIVTHKGDMENNYRHLMVNMRDAIGDSLYIGEGVHGKHSFGYAGGAALKGFVGLVSSARNGGIWSALNIEPGTQETHIRTMREILDAILMYLSTDTKYPHDDAAAINAMNIVLIEIMRGCEDEMDVNERLQNATEDNVRKWIIDYEIEYILEYSAMVFQSHIFDKCDQPDAIRQQIANWLRGEIERDMTEQIRRIDLATEEGRNELEKLTAQILDIWQQE